MRKILILLVSCVSIAGCAQDIYDKPGATEAEFGQDMGYCKMVALGMAPVQPAYVPPSYSSVTTYNGTYGYGLAQGTATTTTQANDAGQGMANLGAAIATVGRERAMLHACMASRGYSLRDK
jgi:hypothetical protein